MREFNVALLTVGLLVLLVGLASGYLQRRSILSEPLVALTVGCALGPLGFGLLRPQGWGNPFAILEEVTRLTLALSLISTALRLPRHYLRRHWRPLAVMLGVVLPLSWLVVGGLGILLGFSPLLALLIGAVAAPTDPVLAGAIVSGETAQRNIPGRVRHLLSAESGANDGLAYPLALLPILLLHRPVPAAFREWLLHVVLWEVVGAAGLGALLGWLAGHVRCLMRPGRVDELDLTSVGAFAFVVLAGTKLLGMDGVFAVFVAGVTLRATQPQLKETQGTQEALNRFFVLPVFALLGLLLPWREWTELGWCGGALALGALLVRRLPFLLALRPGLSPLHRSRDAWLLGWFGPIGVGALFYATLGLRETGSRVPWTVGSLFVVTSIVLHGLSATPLTHAFGHAEKRSRASAPQSGARDQS